jgi:hypothetical protein
LTGRDNPHPEPLGDAGEIAKIEGHEMSRSAVHREVEQHVVIGIM